MTTKARRNAVKLVDYVSLKDFGGVGDGTTDNYAAIVAWLAALSLGNISGETRFRKGYIPAGVYAYNGNISWATTGNAGGLNIVGDGSMDSILYCTATSGTALSIATNRFTLQGFGVYASAARTSGSGNGITIDAGLATTSFEGTLRDIQVLNQPGIGVNLVRVEHHILEQVLVGYCGQQGIYLTGGAGSASWNILINCRAQFCGGIGIELSSSAFHNTLIHPEVLSCTAASQMKIHGRGNILINADCEATNIITGATAYTGLTLIGSRHKVLGGYFGDLNTMIELISCINSVVEDPTFTNGASGVIAPVGLNEDSASKYNRISLTNTATNVTAIISPSAAQPGTVLIQDGLEVASALSERIIAVAGGSAYTPNVFLGSYIVITLDQNITINLPSNARANQKLKFRFVQGGAGGWTVTWNVGYKKTWSNVGNVAGAQSMINFVYAGGGVHIQDSAQSPYA